MSSVVKHPPSKHLALLVGMIHEEHPRFDQYIAEAKTEIINQAELMLTKAIQTLAALDSTRSPKNEVI